MLLNRRSAMCLGSLGLVGLSLPKLLAAEETRSAAASAQGRSRPRAKSCILVFLEGGPSHIDLWDMKPHAPLEVRGEFRPIATSLPSRMVCEHLPMLARQMHHLAMIRSVHHRINDHNAGAYYALTGREPIKGSRLIVKEEPDNFPPFGAVLAAVARDERPITPFVHIPDVMSNLGFDIPGQMAGFLGAGFDPLVAGDPSVRGYEVPGLSAPRDVRGARFARRRELLSALEESAAPRGLPSDGGVLNYRSHYERAFDLLSTSDAQRAFDVNEEPLAVRERYGLPDRDDRSVEARKFGGLPHLGQSMLLARRLIEAGVRLVTVCTGRRIDQAWDTHRDHFPLLKQSLLPYFDRAFSALLSDMHERGPLDETLVVAMGEFGRTPRLGQITSGAGATPAGRDHWPYCYTVMLAGAGIAAGAEHGASDKIGAHPARDPVTPEDVAATIYTALGIDPESRILDALNRPHSVALGAPIRSVLA